MSACITVNKNLPPQWQKLKELATDPGCDARYLCIFSKLGVIYKRRFFADTGE